MANEQSHARGPIAAAINRTPGLIWLPNINPGPMAYESGLPDGFAVRLHDHGEITRTGLLLLASKCGQGKRMKELLKDMSIAAGDIAALEFKYGEGSIHLGDPTGKLGWRQPQRDWYKEMAAGLIPYRIVARIMPYRASGRAKPDIGWFSVPPHRWLEAEDRLGDRQRMALNAEMEREHDYKERTCETLWSGCETNPEFIAMAIKTGELWNTK
jgi:hypothetical protein